MATRASSGARSSSSTSASVLRRGSRVQLIDPASGGAYAFVKSQSREWESDGIVCGGWRSCRHRQVTREMKTARGLMSGRRFECWYGETTARMGARVRGALRYGFEHIKSGLLLQRRQRGMQKLVFCSNKFGVNEQFDCHSVGDGVLRLVNRRCRGMWDVRVALGDGVRVGGERGNDEGEMESRGRFRDSQRVRSHEKTHFNV